MSAGALSRTTKEEDHGHQISVSLCADHRSLSARSHTPHSSLDFCFSPAQIPSASVHISGCLRNVLLDAWRCWKQHFVFAVLDT